MNLWIFNQYAIPPQLPGSTRHFDLGHQLVKHGYRVTIFATSFFHKQHREVRLEPGQKWNIETVNDVQFVWLKTFPYQRNDWRRALNILHYTLNAWNIGRKLPRLSREIGSPDVVIGSSVYLLPALAAYWVAKYYKVKFIMEILDLFPQTLIDMGKLSQASPVTKMLQHLEKFLYKRAHKIIILSPLTGDYLNSLGIPANHICLIPNGVEMSQYENSAMHKPSTEKFTVMYFGSHGVVNDLDIILDAAKIIQDKGMRTIRFFFVGDGLEKARLQSKKESLGLQNVEFLTSVPKEKSHITLRQADAFVLVENKVLYGSSNKLADYMATGRPVVFSTFAQHNTVQGARCGLSVKPRDPHALAEATIKLAQMSPQEREVMGRCGFEYVKTHLAIPVLAEKLVECIEQDHEGSY